MATLSNHKVTLSQLLEQVQEKVKNEVLQKLKHTFEEILETFRDKNSMLTGCWLGIF